MYLNYVYTPSLGFQKTICFQGQEPEPALFRPLFLRVWDSNNEEWLNQTFAFMVFPQFKKNKTIAHPNGFRFPILGLLRNFLPVGALLCCDQVTASFFTTFSSNMNSLLCSSSCSFVLRWSHVSHGSMARPSSFPDRKFGESYENSGQKLRD